MPDPNALDHLGLRRCRGLPLLPQSNLRLLFLSCLVVDDELDALRCFRISARPLLLVGGLLPRPLLLGLLPMGVFVFALAESAEPFSKVIFRHESALIAEFTLFS